MTSQSEDRSLKVLAVVTRVRSAMNRRALLGIALVVFVVAFVLGLTNLPEGQLEPRWGFIALSFFIGVPATVLFNALEYVMTARIAGHNVRLSRSIEVSVLASAANLLPIPGSALVRAEAIRRIGGKTGRAVLSTATAGLAWIAVSGALAGVALAFGDDRLLGVVAIGVSVALGAAAYVAVRRQTQPHATSVMVRLVLVEIGSVLVKAARVWLVIRAFGHDVTVVQALVLALAAVIAIAMGFFPGGLGASELLSGLAAPVVDLSAAVGVTASAIDRLITLGGLGVLTAFLWTRRRRRVEPIPDEPDVPEPPDPL
jgi:uncharacterized membrane protein YbhN (UPF0104 family)